VAFYVALFCQCGTKLRYRKDYEHADMTKTCDTVRPIRVERTEERKTA
jgi:hypothetical protein